MLVLLMAMKALMYANLHLKHCHITQPLLMAKLTGLKIHNYISFREARPCDHSCMVKAKRPSLLVALEPSKTPICILIKAKSYAPAADTRPPYS